MSNSDTFVPEVSPTADAPEATSTAPKEAPKPTAKASLKKGSLPKIEAPLATTGKHELPNGLVVITN